MYKARLQRWGFSKNSKRDDWAAIANLHKTRLELGKPSAEFLVHGRKKTVRDLRMYIRSRKMSEKSFLEASEECIVPPHVRCYTPDLGGTRSSSSQSSSEGFSTPSPQQVSSRLRLAATASNSPPLLLPTTSKETNHNQMSSGNLPIPSTTDGEHFQGSELQLDDMSSGADFVLLPSISVSTPCLSHTPCHQTQQDIRTMASQMITPVSLMSAYGTEDIQSWIFINSNSPPSTPQNSETACPNCHQPSSAHFVSLESLAPLNPEQRDLLCDSTDHRMTLPSTMQDRGGPWTWAALCFLACIYLGRGNVELSTTSLTNASIEFEKMLSTRDPLILTALNLMVSMLHMHTQGKIAESIVRSALDVAERILEPGDPVKATIEWMTAAAGGTLRKCGSYIPALRHVLATFKAELGPSHLYTLAALYNLAWTLLHEGSYAETKDISFHLYAEAEDILEQLYKASYSVLGPLHLQSITALNTLSRVQSKQDQDDAAIETLQRSIRDSERTLGRSHPMRLESKRRLALLYKKTGRKEEMEPLYWDVLRGRIKMLGKEHPFTDGARTDLTNLLKELQKWDEEGSTQWLIDELFEAPSEIASQHESF